jgi:GT2 family glycosyltransferase
MSEDGSNGEEPVSKVLAVFVRHKMPLHESPTFQGLLQAFASHPELQESLNVLIWDNSPAQLNNPEILPTFIYRHSPRNLGVSGAYNQAMKIAEAMGCQWLLLLDQDTAVTADFLPRMVKLGCRFLHKPEIAAVVPFLMDGDFVLSPRKVLFKKFKPMDKPFEGIYPGEVTAANSGALMRIEALEQIGGFNEDFWLDFSDVVVFHLLHRRGKQVYIAGDLQLMHKISVLDFENSMTPERYASFIAAEGAFWDIYRTGIERAFHTMRILERGIRQMRSLKTPAYSRITLGYFLKRLLLGKKQRLSWWKLQSCQREIPRQGS